MDSQKLANEQLGSGSRAWHARFNDALAARDLDLYLGFLDETCSLQINNAMPIYSKLAIRAAYALYLTSFVTLKFEIMNVLGDERQSVCEVLYTYGCNDGSTEVVQTLYIADFDEAGMATSIRVYGNGARVFRPFMRAND